jgi:tetratricopeptide (TPR) repeat protein
MLVYHRPHEAGALLQEAIRLARTHDLSQALLRAQFNFAGLAIEHDRLDEARNALVDALAHARLRGDRTWESGILGQLGEVLVLTGEWDEAWEMLDPLGKPTVHESLRLSPSIGLLVARGLVADARQLMEQAAELADSTDKQTQAIYFECDAQVSDAEGRNAQALESARRAFELWRALKQTHYEVISYAVAVDSALALGEVDRAAALLQQLRAIPPVERREFVDAHVHRLAAKIAAARGAGAARGFAIAAETFRELSMPYWVGVTLCEAAEAGAADGSAEARAIFERLRARPWLDRLERASVTV